MTWATVPSLARRLEIDESAIRRWCVKHLVICEKLPGRFGQWRVAVNERGFPLKTPASSSGHQHAA